MTQPQWKRRVATAALVAAAAAVPQLAQAVVLVSGCAGGNFGAACSLAELAAGGSITVDGYRFSTFTLALNGGRLLDASVIRVDAIEGAAGPGFTLVDTGQTLRAANGDVTSNNLGFDITPLAGSALIAGSRLSVAVGDLNAAGSYANVYADLFNPGFTTFVGNMTAYCDGPACTNSTLASPLTFAATGAMAVVAGIDIAAGPAGLARITGISMVLTPVPEPAAWVLMVAGLGTVAWWRRQRRAPSAAGVRAWVRRSRP